MMPRNERLWLFAGAAVILAERLLTMELRFTSPIEASFGRALLGFNPFLHQPPPPCYPLYVGLGKFVNFFVHDSLVSLLLLTIAGSIATFLLLARRYPMIAALIVALIPPATHARPDALAIAFVAAALYAWRKNAVLFGIFAAAAIGCVPQSILGVALLMVAAPALPASGDRRPATVRAWLAFAVTLIVEFMQTMQNINLRRLPAFVRGNMDLRHTFDPIAAWAVPLIVLAALTYHLVLGKIRHLPRDPDVQRGSEY
jgi:hypothetical protein